MNRRRCSISGTRSRAIFLRPAKAQPVNQFERSPAERSMKSSIVTPCNPHVSRDGVDTRAVTAGQGRLPLPRSIQIALPRRARSRAATRRSRDRRAAPLHPDFAEAAAVLAPAVGRVEGEQARVEFLEGAPQPGQLISVLSIVRRFFPSRRCAVPRPISRAR